MIETIDQKTDRNKRVQARYDELMRAGKHGHYETMFRVVREEVTAAVMAEKARCMEAARWYQNVENFTADQVVERIRRAGM